MGSRVTSPPLSRVTVLVAGIAAFAAVQCKPRSSIADAGGTSPTESAAASAAAAASARPPRAPIAIMSGDPRVDVTVDVGTMLKDYKGNELRGDNTYKGKRVRIIGKAGEFKRDITNTIYMTVGTGAPLEIPEAQCFFGNEYAGWVSSLTKGSTVVLSCKVEGLMMNVLMKDCSGIAGTDTLNACHKLRDAGAVKACSLGYGAATIFYVSDLPGGASERAAVSEEATTRALTVELGLLTHAFPAQPDQSASPSPTAKDWVDRSVGLVFRLGDDVDGKQALAQVQSDAGVEGLGNVVGSAAARIAVVLPPRGSPDLQPRVQAVVDRWATASK